MAACRLFDGEGYNASFVRALLRVMGCAAFRKETAHFSGSGCRDLGRIMGEV